MYSINKNIFFFFKFCQTINMAANNVKLGLSSSLKFKYMEGEIIFLISSLVDKILSMLRLIGQFE